MSTQTQPSPPKPKSRKRSHNPRQLYTGCSRDPDVLRILLGTDIHLGYMEHDLVRSNDSFNTFNEILELGNLNYVDFVLLGGDLYHYNKPSRNTQYQCNSILARHVLGERNIEFNVISDQSINFTQPNQSTSDQTNTSNIYNQNINIKLPIFTIHGNHDDPAGHASLSPLDLLHQSLLVNYFGRQDKLDHINIHPIVVQKGSTVVNIYGLGSIRDERLYRSFQAGQVRFIENNQLPINLGDNNESMNRPFNLAIIHQNRIKHSVTDKNYLPESFLPRWLDFIHWGHEHECIPEPYTNSDTECKILQIGSSIATSLANGEAKTKHIAIIEIKHSSYRFNTIALNTVRPFDISEIKLSDMLSTVDADTTVIEDLLDTYIQSRIDVIHNDTQYHNHDRPKLPLIRVKIDHTGFPRINTIRFGQRFVNKVANPDDLLLWYKKSTIYNTHNNGSKSNDHTVNNTALELLESNDPDAPPPIYDLVSEIITATTPLNVLSDSSFSTAVQSYVEKKETNAISDMIDSLIKKCSMDTKTALNQLNNNQSIELTDGDIISQIKSLYHTPANNTNKPQQQKHKRLLGINLADVDKTLRQVEQNTNNNTDLFGSGDDEYVYDSDSDSDTIQSNTAAKKKRVNTTTRTASARGRGRGMYDCNTIVFTNIQCISADTVYIINMTQHCRTWWQ